jgi:hypothetical protein
MVQTLEIGQFHQSRSMALSANKLFPEGVRDPPYVMMKLLERSRTRVE